MTDRHEAEGHGKVVKCYIRRGRVYGHDLYKPTTPAVAIAVEAYNEVRTRLADMAVNADFAHERDWASDTLALLPEAPQ